MTTLMDVFALLAAGPSRELDAKIFCALNPGYTLGTNSLGGAVLLFQGFRRTLEEAVPPFTTSVNDALALVEQRLPGWHIALKIWSDHASCHIGKSVWPEQDAASAALAILKALVAALIAQDA